MLEQLTTISQVKPVWTAQIFRSWSAALIQHSQSSGVFFPSIFSFFGSKWCKAGRAHYRVQTYLLSVKLAHTPSGAVKEVILRVHKKKS
jgi:hypothetical protein